MGGFSVATYLRYRAAAVKAFDIDLLNNLETLQDAMREEIGEAEREPPTGAEVGLSVLARAAGESVGAFRLSGLYAEIRSGPAAGTLLARSPGAGIPNGGRLLGEEAWAPLASSMTARVLELPGGRRGVVRTFRSHDAAGENVTLLVADRTTLVDQTLRAIRGALMQYGAVGLFLALAGGSWLATRALRPIDTLTSQAAAMAAAPAPHGQLAIPNTADELGRLGLTFNRLLERLEQSASQTRAFIADAAHELKTPVTIVRTEAELSLSGERSLAESRESLVAIAAESTHLSRLVSNLTMLAEGELLAQPLERRLVDLTELVHEVARSLRSLSTGRRITVEIEAAAGIECRGDERLLRQVLTNLVENAIKFSQPGARIGIALSRLPGALELRVLDEAPTLAVEDRERVFERFYRSRQARRSGEMGSGLGLAIVRWAVSLHGGRVWIESRTPLGNVFVTELPAPAKSGEPSVPRRNDTEPPVRTISGS